MTVNARDASDDFGFERNIVGDEITSGRTGSDHNTTDAQSKDRGGQAMTQMRCSSPSKLNALTQRGEHRHQTTKKLIDEVKLYSDTQNQLR